MALIGGFYLLRDVPRIHRFYTGRGHGCIEPANYSKVETRKCPNPDEFARFVELGQGYDKAA